MTEPHPPGPGQTPGGTPAAADPAGIPLFSRGYVRYALGLLLAVAVFNTCDRTILGVLIEDIQAEIEVSDTQMGLLIGFAFTTVHLLAGLPIARLADRVSRKLIVSIGLLAWSVMTALAGFAQSFGQLLLARMGVGVGEAAGSPPSHSMIADFTPVERRARALAIIPIGSILGLGLGNVFGGWVNEFFGWRMAFISVGVPGVALAAVIWLTLREPPRGYSDGAVASRPASDESMLAVILYLLGRPSYRYMILGACLAGVTTYGRNLWEPTFLRRVYEMSSGEAGTWYFLIGPLPSLFGVYFGGWIVDRLALRDERWYMWFGAIACAVSVPLSFAFLLWPETHYAGPVPVGFLFALAMALVVGMWSPATMALGQSLAKPHMRSLSAALWSMIYNFIGLGAGPFMVGVLSDYFEPLYQADALRYALVLAGLSPLLAAVCQLRAARTLREDLALARQV